jgi:hypothetical protein
MQYPVLNVNAWWRHAPSMCANPSILAQEFKPQWDAELAAWKARAGDPKRPSKPSLLKVRAAQGSAVVKATVDKASTHPRSLQRKQIRSQSLLDTVSKQLLTGRNAKFAQALARIYWREFLIAGLLQALYAAVQIAGPMILRKIVMCVDMRAVVIGQSMFLLTSDFCARLLTK